MTKHPIYDKVVEMIFSRLIKAKKNILGNLPGTKQSSLYRLLGSKSFWSASDRILLFIKRSYQSLRFFQDDRLVSRGLLFLCGVSLVALTIAGVKFQEKSSLSLSTIIPLPKTLSSLPFPSYDLSVMNTYKGLPVGKLEVFNVKNALATVIYIPQYHKNPGTTADDPKNDSAQKAQGEIYQILNFLTKQPNVNFIMEEGDLYGKVGAEKVMTLADKIQKRNDLVSLTAKLEKSFNQKSLDSGLENSLISKLKDEQKKVDREIILSGAPLKLKAEGKNITLYGSENQQTLEQSTVLVRDYIYLQDRLSQVNNPSTGVNALGLPGSDNTSNLSNSGMGSDYKALLSLLGQGGGGNDISGDFSSLESLASSQNNKDLVGLLQKAENAYNNLENVNSASSVLTQTASTTSTTGGTSRSDNPYMAVNDKTQLEEKIKQDETQINSLIVDRRNKETAQNMADVLKQEKKPIGILQFGAGHEEGLVKELNKQGLSVIVITPNEAVARAKAS